MYTLYRKCVYMYIGEVLAQIALNYEMKGKGEQF